MNERKGIKSMERRNFIKSGLGIGAVGAVAIGLSKSSVAATPGTGAKPGKSGYRETKHVATYYAIARS